MNNLESRLSAIEQRNSKVEAEKAWEVSLTRKLLIVNITYATAAIFLWWIGSTAFYLEALVPTGGYLLSTISIPLVKKIWIRRLKR